MLVSILAISYFGSSDIPHLLESLIKQDASNWKLFIIDNSENDVEHSLLLKLTDRDSRAIVLKAPKNLGYFGAARWGFKTIGSPKDSWVVVSNTDLTFSSPHFVSSIATREDPQVGVIAPQIISDRTGLNQNPHLIVRPSARLLRRRWLLLSHPVIAQITILGAAIKAQLRRIRNRIQSTSLDTSTREMEIYAPHGSCIVISPNYFEHGGCLEHPAFLFAEEISLAEDCRRFDLKIIYDPSLRITHVQHGQMGIFRSRKVLSYSAEGAKYAYEMLKRN